MKQLRQRSHVNDYSIRTLERAIRLLNCFTFQRRELSLLEISTLTRLPKSTAFRILHTLEKHKFVVHDPQTGLYSLGMKLFELGGIVFSSLSLRKTSSRFLDLLKSKVNHTVLMGILEEGELVYIDKREADDPIKVSSEIGRRRPPYYGMLGKTLMAYLPEDEIDRLLKQYPLERVAPQSITDIEKFKRSLREIRRRGYTFEHGEAVEGVIGIAAPVRNHLRHVAAAVGVALPAFNTGPQEIERAIRAVTETAKEISEALGYVEAKEGG